MTPFHLTVARVHENVFDAEAVSVTVPASDGEMTILANHEPFVAALKAGSLLIKESDGASPRVVPITGGVVETSAHQVTILL